MAQPIIHRQRERGITSFFAVIFAATLLTILVVSFAALMTREQSRSSDAELSRSAYDSAVAGVEDAKRVIKLSLDSSVAGDAARAAIAANSCDTVARAGVAGAVGGQETVIQSTAAPGGAALNQAYTCVKIDPDSANVEFVNMPAARSKVVPLRSQGDFNRVDVEWHSASGAVTNNPCSEGDLGITPLCQLTAWPAGSMTHPALLRAQFITPGSTIDYDRLDKAAGGNTVFLYPKSGTPDVPTVDLSAMPRFVDENGEVLSDAHAVKRTVCVQSAIAVGYHCKASISVSVSAADSERTILRLTPIYNATSVNLTLWNGTTPVKFRGVQPLVDSTGRANDLFRRVKARISLEADVQYPEYAVDLGSAFCKDFYVLPTEAQQLATSTPGDPVCKP